MKNKPRSSASMSNEEVYNMVDAEEGVVPLRDNVSKGKGREKAQEKLHSFWGFLRYFAYTSLTYVSISFSKGWLISFKTCGSYDTLVASTYLRTTMSSNGFVTVS